MISVVLFYSTILALSFSAVLTTHNWTESLENCKQDIFVGNINGGVIVVREDLA